MDVIYKSGAYLVYLPLGQARYIFSICPPEDADMLTEGNITEANWN